MNYVGGKAKMKKKSLIVIIILKTRLKIILMIMMYGGRIGGLSLVLVFGQRKPEAPVKRPTEQILIG